MTDGLGRFAFLIAVGLLVRRILDRYEEAERERALHGLADQRPQVDRNLLTEKRAIWLFGAMTGWSGAAYVQTHNWELLAWALLGMYGLLDIAALNATVTRRRTRRRR